MGRRSAKPTLCEKRKGRATRLFALRPERMGAPGYEVHGVSRAGQVTYWEDHHLASIAYTLEESELQLSI
jgi:hypothetical protein